MVSPAESAGSEPVDPAYASLFRPADEAEPEAPDELAADESAEAEPLDDVPPEPAAEEPIAEPSIDTGRLFRSQGVTDRPDALLAVGDHARRLRTLARSDAPVAGPPTTAEPIAVPVGGAVVIDEEGDVPDRGRGRRTRSPRPDRDAPPRRRGSREITAGAVYILVIGVTVAAAFADALLHNGDLGWLTGVAMAIVSIYCALTVTRDDDVVAIYTPPIAFLIATLTAGQLFLGSADKSVINRAVVVFFGLADNWYWIIGTTLVVIVIVAVRRRRA